MSVTRKFPNQAISDRSKTKAWAKQCVEYYCQNSVLSSSIVRKTTAHMKINYDLFDNKLNMSDLALIIDPTGRTSPDKIKPIQSYPIMRSKIMLLVGEEIAAKLDYDAVVTNPDILSEMSERKAEEVNNALTEMVSNQNMPEEEFNNKINSMADYFAYDYRDDRELFMNCLLTHYWDELNMAAIFRDGYIDGCIVGEEIYQCGIRGGEPFIVKLNPEKVRVYQAGFSREIENSDAIVIEDYWQPSKIIEVFGDQLTTKDVKQIMDYANKISNGDDDDDIRNRFIWGDAADQIREYSIDGNSVWLSFIDGVNVSQLPFDIAGNIRVMQVFWKSLSKCLKVKRYDEETGEFFYDIMPESYIVDEELGEESKYYWKPTAWQGTMIGAGEDAIFVDMRECPVQFNTLDNPSKCHFGIIGSIYSHNENRPFTLVDMMKPYNYAYNIVKDRINKLQARNLGNVAQFNLHMIPAGWTTEKFIQYIKNDGMAFVDPFNEAMKGKPAGLYNIGNNVSMDNSQAISALEATAQNIYLEMGSIIGITPQREGQVSNRETFGGVERATLQSSHTTRWYSQVHSDCIKRTLDCFLEYAKLSVKGKTKKINYICPDQSRVIMEIDGSIVNESSYGVVLRPNYDTQSMNQNINMVAQAEAQNGKLGFASYLKILRNNSISDKVRIVERDERKFEQQQQQQQQIQNQLEQQRIEAEQARAEREMQLKEAELAQKVQMNSENNETRVLVAQIQSENREYMQRVDMDHDGHFESLEAEKMGLDEEIRQFNETMVLEREKLKTQERIADANNKSKEKIARMKPKTTNTSKK